ncbi:Trk system potassium transporter TrkA [Candidatus Poribacteria bacterium]|jgi:trk system potassium uptake protein|nr:Trk system potassium transporter TrkA [Candidatus Poribacteria bacterium]MBT5710457.1 Trk system potassium transporter TrkA [Candidatus Poribacteria bacterium]MBT7099952.1 Trk system potassium transporter TrkA [Candidatus Poribacteria bacterium]MBT7806184.1 Trk system potassium transporter TrkA [Candidatus Poribacteria bacterium]
MKAIIIGAGEVGYHTAAVLTAEQHDVVVIDQSLQSLGRAEEHFDLMTVHGSGASPLTLQQAGPADADLLIAVTNSDEINILACLVGHRMNIPLTAARVSSPDYFAEASTLAPKDIGIDLVVNPDELCAQEFFRLLNTPEAREAVDFVHGQVQLIAFQMKAGNPLCGREMRELRQEVFTHPLLIAAIKRPDGSTVVPSGHDTIHDGDEIFAFGSPDAVHELLHRSGVTERPLHRVVIAGCGRVGVGLARILEDAGAHVTLIDRDLGAAERASETLRRATVIHGEPLHDDVLEEANVSEADGFVSATGDDEHDIMACVAAKQKGAARVLSLIQKPRYLPVLDAMPSLDGAVSRHLTAVGHILRLIRRGEVISVASLHEIEAEAIELVAGKDARVLGHPLGKMKFPKDALVGAIVRDGEVIMPSGHDEIHAGDRVVVFCLPQAVGNVEKLFASR